VGGQSTASVAGGGLYNTGSVNGTPGAPYSFNVVVPFVPGAGIAGVPGNGGPFGTFPLVTPLTAAGTPNIVGVPGYAPTAGCINSPQTSNCAYPGDKWAGAVNAGIVFNAPWIAPGDKFGAYGQWGRGATAYSNGPQFQSMSLFGKKGLAIVPVTDAVYVNGSGLELTTGWSAAAWYLHYWTPSFSTLLWAAHTEVSYSNTVKNSQWFCGLGGAINQDVHVLTKATASAFGLVSNGNCNPDGGLDFIGVTQNWYPFPNFRLGIEVMYSNVETSFKGATLNVIKNSNDPRLVSLHPLCFTAVIGCPPGSATGGLYTASNQGIIQVLGRAYLAFPSALVGSPGR